MVICESTSLRNYEWQYNHLRSLLQRFCLGLRDLISIAAAYQGVGGIPWHRISDDDQTFCPCVSRRNADYSMMRILREDKGKGR